MEIKIRREKVGDTGGNRGVRWCGDAKEMYNSVIGVGACFMMIWVGVPELYHSIDTNQLRSTQSNCVTCSMEIKTSRGPTFTSAS